LAFTLYIPCASHPYACDSHENEVRSGDLTRTGEMQTPRAFHRMSLLLN